MSPQHPENQDAAPPSATYWDTQATSWGSLKTSWLVLLLCISCPLTLQRMRRLWTSAEEIRHLMELEKKPPALPNPHLSLSPW